MTLTQGAVPQWRDISTAPKDGTEVIVFAPDNDPPVFTASCLYDKWSASVEGRHAPADDFFGDDPKRPTHWMPLPEPPEQP